MVAVDPVWMNGLTYDAVDLRRIQVLSSMTNGTWTGARSGIIPGSGGLAVSLTGSAISVGVGNAWIHRAGQGMYGVSLVSGASLTLTPAHATLPRVDLVYLRVWDNSVDASGLNTADAVYLAGTASSTPAAPIPAGTQIYLPLATISVPPSGGGTPSVSQAVLPKTVAPGGILPDPAAVGYYTGQYRDNGTNLERYNGATWETYQRVLSTAWIDLPIAAGFTTPFGSFQKAQYRTRLADGTQRVELRGSLACTTDVTSQTTFSTIPAGFRPSVLRTLPVTRNYNSSTSGTTRIEISGSGGMSVFGSPSPSQTSWFCMDGLSYDL